MFERAPGLSTFGDSPEDALKEFGVMLQGAIESGLKVSSVAALAPPSSDTDEGSKK